MPTDEERYSQFENRDPEPMGAAPMDKQIGHLEEHIRRRHDRTISHERRIMLQGFAQQIAADVLRQTKPHERCLLRVMVENLLPDER